MIRFDDAKLVAYCASNTEERFAAVYFASPEIELVDSSTAAGRVVLLDTPLQYSSCDRPALFDSTDTIELKADGSAIDRFTENGAPQIELLPATVINEAFSATGFTNLEGTHYLQAYRYKRPDNSYVYFTLNKTVTNGNASYLLMLPN